MEEMIRTEEAILNTMRLKRTTKYHEGDHVKFFGYTEEAYRNGSVPTFMQNEGTLIWVDNQWYVKLANEWILPLYYCANIEIIPSQKVSPIRRT